MPENWIYRSQESHSADKQNIWPGSGRNYMVFDGRSAITDIKLAITDIKLAIIIAV